MIKLIKQFRLHRYQKTLQQYPLNPNHTATIIPNLLRVWNKVVVSDFEYLPLRYWYRGISTHTETLVGLIEALKEQNRDIEHDREVVLDRKLKESRTIKPKLLDTYCTDQEGLPIDLAEVLSELQLHLNLHHSCVRGEDSEYYIRVTAPLYRDIAALTYALLSKE